MATRQRSTASWRFPVLLLLLFAVKCLVAECSTPAAGDLVQTSVSTDEGNKAFSPSSDDELEKERPRATDSGGAESRKKAPQRSTKTPTEEADIELLRSAMAAADVTETERNTDARHFLGVSRRMRRHVIVDFLGLIALLAGYHLIVAGLDHKGPTKTSRKSHKS